MNLSLNVKEAEAMGVVLESYISDLRIEIAGTERRQMREELKHRERELRSIQRKLLDLTAPGGTWPYEPAPDVDEQELAVPIE